MVLPAGKAVLKYLLMIRIFTHLKDVPHGKVQQILFPSESTNTSAVHFVYTPPDYDKDNKNAIRYCIFSMAGARMKLPGATRDMLI